MTLKDVLQQFLNEMEWHDDITYDADIDEHVVATSIVVDEKTYRLFLHTDEPLKLLKIFLYVPFDLPRDRLETASSVVNVLNRSLHTGHLEVFETGEIRYRNAVDVENIEASAAFFHNLLAAACGTFQRRPMINALGSLTFTSSSQDQIISEFDAALSPGGAAVRH